MTEQLDSGRKHYRTPRGFLVRKYRNMRDRVDAKPNASGRGNTFWLGLEIAPRDDFIEWALNHPDFQKTFAAWQESGYDRSMVPVVHRIKRDKGYLLNNILWVPSKEKPRKKKLDKQVAA